MGVGQTIHQYTGNMSPPRDDGCDGRSHKRRSAAPSTFVASPLLSYGGELIVHPETPIIFDFYLGKSGLSLTLSMCL